MGKAQKPSATTRAALIGLVGAVLTVCGGLGGALFSGAATIYRVERSRQKVALAAPEGDQALTVDAGSIFISRQQAAALDADRYFVDLDHGIAIRRPLPDWGELEELTVEEQLAENNAQCFGLCDQPVYRIRYGAPIEIQADSQTLVNGKPIPDEWLAALETLYGPPPWTYLYYSQFLVNVFDKSAEEMRLKGLPDLVLLTTHFSAARVNRLIAEENSDFIVVQSSAAYDRIRMQGQMTSFTLESWVLFTEGENAYYVVEISFTPQSGQPLQVWEDLQTYMDSFRAVQ
ncbi:MAG: hypothetical protein JXA14_17000 [Anaerolineae bacterium]|nr:hypothetical protein [Anaerolineae bacterium]